MLPPPRIQISFPKIRGRSPPLPGEGRNALHIHILSSLEIFLIFYMGYWQLPRLFIIIAALASHIELGALTVAVHTRRRGRGWGGRTPGYAGFSRTG